MTATPNEVMEMALAHSNRDKTEAAHRRGDLLVERRRLMEARAAYLDSEPTANVAPLRARQA